MCVARLSRPYNRAMNLALPGLPASRFEATTPSSDGRLGPRPQDRPMKPMTRDLSRPSRRQILGIGVSAAAAVSTFGVTTGCSRRRTPATFVLVHGASHGGWCWQRVSDLLTANG